MFRIFIVLLMCTFASSKSTSFESRYIGIVDEFKIIKQEKDGILCWIKSGYQTFSVICSDTPDIYVGDSLFVYWLNYRKFGIGKNNGNVYRIEE